MCSGAPPTRDAPLLFLCSEKNEKELKDGLVAEAGVEQVVGPLAQRLA